MPPKFGTKADLEYIDRLIQDGISEGQNLEFKEAIPVSPEQQKSQAKSGELLNGKAIDRAVHAGSGIGEYGRNKLLEEIVAFANADGGSIIIGLSETQQEPPRAQSLTPIPFASALERRLQNQIIDQIEPRLPSFSTKTIAVGEDGAGVIIIETQGSVVGPHWVRSTRGAMIRRGDKCVPLSMLELHDMVLRNARRFDDVRQRLMRNRQSFPEHFAKEGNRMIFELANPNTFFGFEQWIAANPGRAVLGVRCTIVPHSPLGLRRLENIRDITCDGSVDIVDVNGDKLSEINLLLTNISNGRQTLGGVEYFRPGKEISIFLRAARDGLIDVKIIWLFNSQSVFSASWLLGVVGSAIAIFDNLRKLGGASDLPAELDIEINTVGKVATQAFGYWSSPLGEPIPHATIFEPITISAATEFDALMNEVAGDFLNAIGLPTTNLPRVVLNLT